MKNIHCSRKLHKKEVQLTLPMAAKNPISLKFLKFNSFPLSYIPPFSRSNFNKAMGCCVPYVSTCNSVVRYYKVLMKTFKNIVPTKNVYPRHLRKLLFKGNNKNARTVSTFLILSFVSNFIQWEGKY